MAESAIFSQWQHSPLFKNLRYARWRNEGEVDAVFLAGDQKPLWIGEIKWSDRIGQYFDEQTKGLSYLLRRHRSIKSVFTTTKTIDTERNLEGHTLKIRPSAAYCYIVGKNITSRLDKPIIIEETETKDARDS